MPKVSVLLPCFNCADTLPDCLDSLLNQSFRDFEILAVDDGSSDCTADVLSEYADRDRRVHPLYLAHGGIVQALNSAILHADGEYLARMDGDDLCRPHRLRKQVDLLDSCPDIGLAGCLAEFGGSREAARGYARYVDWINSLVTPEEIFQNRFVESPLAHPTAMFRRSLPDMYGGYRDGSFPEDYELWLRWMDAGVSMAKVPEPLVVWNDPPDRLSRTDPRYSMDRFYGMKARWLARELARTNPVHPAVTLIGAGRTSRKRAYALLEHGVEIEAYVDIDPKKVGHVIAGSPVIHRDDLPQPGKTFCLSYVGSRGAREDIEAFLKERGFCPGRDYLLAA